MLALNSNDYPVNMQMNIIIFITFSHANFSLFLQIFDDIMTVKKGQKSSMVLDMNQCNAYSSLGYFTSNASSSLLVQQSSSIIFFILLTLILLWIKIQSNHFLNLLCITFFEMKVTQKCLIWIFEFWHFHQFSSC